MEERDGERMCLRLLVAPTGRLQDQRVPDEMSREPIPLPGTEPGQREYAIPYPFVSQIRKIHKNFLPQIFVIVVEEEVVIPVYDRFVVIPLGVKRVFQTKPGEEREPRLRRPF